MGEKQVIHIRTGTTKRKHPRQMSEVRRRMRRRQRRNRLIAAAVILVLLILLVLAGVHCLRPKSETSTLTLRRNGQVDLEEVVSLKGSGAKESDLKDSVRSSLREYNRKHGRNAVRLIRFSHVDGKMYVETRYRNAKTYRDYSGYSLFTGTVKQAKAAGYDFNDTFRPVQKSGRKGWRKSGTTSTPAVLNDKKQQVLILQENIRIRLEGETLRYISDSGTKVTGKNTVSVSPEDGNPDNRQLVYIIY